MSDIAVREQAVIEKLVLSGDLSGLVPAEKIRYYKMFCESLGLNPVTQPFKIIKFEGREQLYATKDCTEQLRKINGVSVSDLLCATEGDYYRVVAKGVDKAGRADAATGIVYLKGKSGDALANVMMKAETKAKRRLTLSICGLGILDESEIETIPGEKTLSALAPNGETRVERVVSPDPKPSDSIAELRRVIKEAQGIVDPAILDAIEKEIPRLPEERIRKGIAWVLAEREKQEALLKVNAKPDETLDAVADKAFEEDEKAITEGKLNVQTGEIEMPKKSAEKELF